MQSSFTRSFPSAIAAILVAGVLTFATVAPVEAGTGASPCPKAKVSATAHASLQ